MHISLDAALQRQPLLSTVGDKLLPTFPGAAAAYSLRALNGDANNVVNVRRDADDEERDFTAEGVALELEDWVNGKLETTLPADVFTYESNFASDVSGFATLDDATLTENVDGIAGKDNNLKIIVGPTTGARRIDVDNAFLVGGSNTLTMEVFIPSDNTKVDQVIVKDVGGVVTQTITNTNAWVSVDQTAVPTNAKLRVQLLDGGSGTISGGDGDVIYIREVKTKANAAAAYSLRKVRNDYSGNAVQIRRASDNVEVNVAFDSNGEVSDSSAITNVVESPDAGDTTATTLGEFLTEATPARNRTGSAKYSTFTPDGVTGFTAITNNIAAGGFDIAGASGTDVQVSFDITLNSGTLTVSLRPDFETGSDVSNSETITTSGSKSFTLTATGDYKAMLFITASADYVISNFSVNVPYNHDATVVTWYDQSVNGNDATQLSTGSQPLIAENGSLIGALEFDGFDDVLGFTELALSSSYAMFGVFDNSALPSNFIARSSTTGNSYINLQSDGDIFWETDTNNDGIVNVNIGTPISGDNLLSCLLASSGTGTAFLNGVSGASASFANTNLTVDQIGARGTSNFLTAKFKEFIIYNTDQSANRFKIESNINNYYGIYNDANEFDASETSFRFLQERVGGTSTSSDLTGFTLDVQTASAYAGAKFSSDVASGDSIYVSFNCSFDSGSPSPKVGLRNVDSSLSGALHSNEGLIVEGFNSLALTSTSDSASGIVWSEGDDNVIFTISNIKISRVSRNGFVETWYDQSGNGNDAVQASTDEQPKIVSAGSYLGELEFDGIDDYLRYTGAISSNGQADTTVFVAKLADNLNTYGFCDNGSNTDPHFIRATATDFGAYFDAVNDLNYATVDTNENLHFVQKSAVSSQSFGSLNGTTDSLNAGTDGYTGGVTIGAARALSNYLNGSMKEFIIYASDQSANRTGIESNIADEYGITLS